MKIYFLQKKTHVKGALTGIELKLVSQLFPDRTGMKRSPYRSLLGEDIGEDRNSFFRIDG